MPDFESMSLTGMLRPLKSPASSLKSACQSRRTSCSADGSQDDINSGFGSHEADGRLPQFERHSEPTLLEIFFDLFFAANYNVFSDTQNITERSEFEAFAGFFCILWLTWLFVTLFDVRFVTDSIFSRVTRAIHLAVFVGFAVAAPKFDPNEQHPETMQVLSLILACSRVCLTIEYGSTLWHVRDFKPARLPFYLQMAVHSASAAGYLGISFHYTRGASSRAYLAWHCLSGLEALLCILLSNLSPVLALTETHLIKRMTLLTVMIIGEAIVQVAQDLVKIVQNSDTWHTMIIPQVTAAAATCYLVFLVYFDWLKSSFHLPASRQQVWSLLHLPFHIALGVFTLGLTQLILWSSIWTGIEDFVNSDFDDFFLSPKYNTSAQLLDSLRPRTYDFLNSHPTLPHTTWDSVGQALRNISQVPDWFWVQAFESSDGIQGGFNATFKDARDESLRRVLSGIITIAGAKTNAFVSTYGISLGDAAVKRDWMDDKTSLGWYWVSNKTSLGFQRVVLEAATNRYYLVFAYTFIAIGASLFLMIVMCLLVGGLPRRPWPAIRLSIAFSLALGTGLAVLSTTDRDLDATLNLTPWLLPATAVVWCIVLLITHINAKAVRLNALRLLNRLKRPYPPAP